MRSLLTLCLCSAIFAISAFSARTAPKQEAPKYSFAPNAIVSGARVRTRECVPMKSYVSNDSYAESVLDGFSLCSTNDFDTVKIAFNVRMPKSEVCAVPRSARGLHVERALCFTPQNHTGDVHLQWIDASVETVALVRSHELAKYAKSFKGGIGSIPFSAATLTH